MQKFRGDRPRVFENEDLIFRKKINNSSKTEEPSDANALWALEWQV